MKQEINLIFKNRSLQESFQLVGEDWRPVLKIQNAEYPKQLLLSIIRNELVKNGLIFGSGFNICLAHTKEGEGLIEKTVNAWDKTSALLADALKSGNPSSFIEGRSVKNVFQVR